VLIARARRALVSRPSDLTIAAGACVRAAPQLKKAAGRMMALPTYAEQKAYVASWTFDEKGGAAAAEVLTYFSATENKLLVGACNLAGRSGLFLSMATLRDAMIAILKSTGRRWVMWRWERQRVARQAAGGGRRKRRLEAFTLAHVGCR
jgi:hypothetical protein